MEKELGYLLWSLSLSTCPAGPIKKPYPFRLMFPLWLWLHLRQGKHLPQPESARERGRARSPSALSTPGAQSLLRWKFACDWNVKLQKVCWTIDWLIDWLRLQVLAKRQAWWRGKCGLMIHQHELAGYCRAGDYTRQQATRRYYVQLDTEEFKTTFDWCRNCWLFVSVVCSFIVYGKARTKTSC